MKKLILLTLVTLLFSCKKEDIKPVEQSNPLTGIYKSTHFHKVEIVPHEWDTNHLFDTTVHEGYSGIGDEPASYIRYSEVKNNSLEMTRYIYGYREIDYSTGTVIKRDIITGPFKFTISGDKLMCTNCGFGINNFSYEISGNILKISYFHIDGANTFYGEEVFHKVSSLPNPSSSGGSGSGCATVQCSAYTQEGNRCQRMTTNCNGRCWQHQ